MIVDLPDEAATARLGAALAEAARPGDVIALRGDLGTGKTALARAFVRRLTTPDEEVPSPTFTLVQTYETDSVVVWHFDLYRLRDPHETIELGIEEAFADGIALVEWPDRLGRLLPPGRLDVTLLPGGRPTARRAELVGHGAWAERIARMAGHV